MEQGTYTAKLRLMGISYACILSAQLFSVVAYSLVPSLKSILLDRVGATSTQIAVIGTTLPQIFAFFLMPVIGIWSDRLRCRWGRRRPFLYASLPFVVLSVIGIGWYDRIAPGAGLPALAFCILAFHLFALIPEGVLYYLIADVIPQNMMGRFYGVNAAFSAGFAAAFSYFFLGYSLENRQTAVLLFSGLLAAAFLTLLPFVKEKDTYTNASAPAPIWSRESRGILMETFASRLFVCTFLCGGINQASTLLRMMFTLLFTTKELGMSANAVGRIGGLSGAFSALVMMLCGVLIDKFRPLRIYLIGSLCVILVSLGGFFFITSEKTYLIFAFLTTTAYAIQGIAYAPLLMRIFPLERYGQFYSVNTMVTLLILAVASAVGGRMTDLFGYRVIFLWDFVFTCLATLILIFGCRGVRERL